MYYVMWSNMSLTVLTILFLIVVDLLGIKKWVKKWYEDFQTRKKFNNSVNIIDDLGSEIYGAFTFKFRGSNYVLKVLKNKTTKSVKLKVTKKTKSGDKFIYEREGEFDVEVEREACLNLLVEVNPLFDPKN